MPSVPSSSSAYQTWQRLLTTGVLDPDKFRRVAEGGPGVEEILGQLAHPLALDSSPASRRAVRELAQAFWANLQSSSRFSQQMLWAAGEQASTHWSNLDPVRRFLEKHAGEREPEVAPTIARALEALETVERTAGQGEPDWDAERLLGFALLKLQGSNWFRENFEPSLRDVTDALEVKHFELFSEALGPSLLRNDLLKRSAPSLEQERHLSPLWTPRRAVLRALGEVAGRGSADHGEFGVVALKLLEEHVASLRGEFVGPGSFASLSEGQQQVARTGAALLENYAGRLRLGGGEGAKIGAANALSLAAMLWTGTGDAEVSPDPLAWVAGRLGREERPPLEWKVDPAQLISAFQERKITWQDLAFIQDLGIGPTAHKVDANRSLVRVAAALGLDPTSALSEARHGLSDFHAAVEQLNQEIDSGRLKLPPQDAAATDRVAISEILLAVEDVRQAESMVLQVLGGPLESADQLRAMWAGRVPGEMDCISVRVVGPAGQQLEVAQFRKKLDGGWKATARGAGTGQALAEASGFFLDAGITSTAARKTIQEGIKKLFQEAAGSPGERERVHFEGGRVAPVNPPEEGTARGAFELVSTYAVPLALIQEIRTIRAPDEVQTALGDLSDLDPLYAAALVAKETKPALGDKLQEAIGELTEAIGAGRQEAADAAERKLGSALGDFLSEPELTFSHPLQRGIDQVFAALVEKHPTALQEVLPEEMLIKVMVRAIDGMVGGGGITLRNKRQAKPVLHQAGYVDPSSPSSWRVLRALAELEGLSDHPSSKALERLFEKVRTSQRQIEGVTFFRSDNPENVDLMANCSVRLEALANRRSDLGDSYRRNCLALAAVLRVELGDLEVWKDPGKWVEQRWREISEAKSVEASKEQLMAALTARDPSGRPPLWKEDLEFLLEYGTGTRAAELDENGCLERLASFFGLQAQAFRQDPPVSLAPLAPTLVPLVAREWTANEIPPLATLSEEAQAGLSSFWKLLDEQREGVVEKGVTLHARGLGDPQNPWWVSLFAYHQGELHYLGGVPRGGEDWELPENSGFLRRIKYAIEDFLEGLEKPGRGKPEVAAMRPDESTLYRPIAPANEPQRVEWI